MNILHYFEIKLPIQPIERISVSYISKINGFQTKFNKIGIDLEQVRHSKLIKK